MSYKEAEIGSRVVLSSKRNRLLRNVNAETVSSRRCKHGRSVPGPASQIQDRLLSHEGLSKIITGDMLIPKIRLHFARHDTLPGKFHHELSFTSLKLVRAGLTCLSSI